MKDYFKEISDLAAQYHKIQLSKRRVHELNARIQEENARKLDLAKEAEKEYSDLKRLENQPLISLFNEVLKSRKEQVQKERQEYLLAIMKYDESSRLIEMLDYEKYLILKSIKSEERIVSDIDAILDLLEPDDLQDKGKVLRRYKDLLIDVKALAKLDVEIEEALDVVLNIQEHFG